MCIGLIFAFANIFINCNMLFILTTVFNHFKFYWDIYYLVFCIFSPCFNCVILANAYVMVMVIDHQYIHSFTRFQFASGSNSRCWYWPLNLWPTYLKEHLLLWIYIPLKSNTSGVGTYPTFPTVKTDVKNLFSFSDSSPTASLANFLLTIYLRDICLSIFKSTLLLKFSFCLAYWQLTSVLPEAVFLSVHFEETSQFLKEGF